MTNFFEQVITHTKLLIKNATQQLDTAKPKIVLGLSGGPDSVFLFHILEKLHATNHITLIAAHLDHEWRTTSHLDAQFCANLCSTSKIDLINTKASNIELSIKFNGSHEDVGRKLRRHLFQTVKQQHAANFIALAHHRQDQQETFFLRLLRGTTLNGLTCMKAIDAPYIRPLLNIDKKTIIDHLTLYNLPYCIDPTNESDTYLRNRIRKYIIPALKLADTRFDQKLESSIRHLQTEDHYLQTQAQETFEQIFTPDEQLVGSLPAFKKLHPALQRRVLMIWLIAQKVPFNPSSAFLDELCRFINQHTGGQHHIGTWALRKKGDKIWLEHPL